jgi:hypothetical protein
MNGGKENEMEECGFCITHGEFTDCPKCAIEQLKAELEKVKAENKRLKERISMMFEQHFRQTNAIFKKLAGFDKCMQDMIEQALK